MRPKKAKTGYEPVIVYDPAAEKKKVAIMKQRRRQAFSKKTSAPKPSSPAAQRPLVQETPWEATGKALQIKDVVADDFAAARIIELGLDASAAVSLEKLIGANQRRKLIPDRTLARRIKEARGLTAEEGDKVLRTARIVTLALRTFGSSEKAHKWLESPKKRFEGETPLDLVATSSAGVAAVEQMLGQIAEGFFA